MLALYTSTSSMKKTSLFFVDDISGASGGVCRAGE